jgi:flagellar basal body-associated protein FliL
MEQKKSTEPKRWKNPQVVIFIGVAIVVLALVFLFALPYFATRPLSKHDLSNLPTQK